MRESKARVKRMPRTSSCADGPPERRGLPNGHVEAARRQYRGQTREGMLAEIRAEFALVEREFGSDDAGRFQELVSGQQQPGWHRVH